MRNAFFGAPALVLSAALMIGCGDSGLSCPDGEIPCDGECVPEVEPNIESVHAQVFSVSCTFSSCHDNQNPAQGLSLFTVEDAMTNLIDVPAEQRPELNRVTASDLDDSYLVNKLRGVDMGLNDQGEPSDQMPQNGELCQAKIDGVLEWIELGAQ